MTGKYLFDKIVSFLGLLFLFPVLIIVWALAEIKMHGSSSFIIQKRVGRDSKLFVMIKFRTMALSHNGSSISVLGESRITPFGRKLRKYKLDELPDLWNILLNDMSFVEPRPDVLGYADLLQGKDRLLLSF